MARNSGNNNNNNSGKMVPISGTATSQMSRKRLVRDFNDILICTLCNGYLIDATTLVDCLHNFCRSCILRYFENNRTGCPMCHTVYKRKANTSPDVYFRTDPQVQMLVYKMVPGLYAREVLRRDDFYRLTGVRANSSCSDDSLLDQEMTNATPTPAPILLNGTTTKRGGTTKQLNYYLSLDDNVSLSMEYYQMCLDDTPIKGKTMKTNCSGTTNSVKRYLQCPAAVSIYHLQKFVRMKHALTSTHKVDIIYKGEVLPSHYNLIDVAYIFSWGRLKPMRFFYRIFVPLKIQPIRIVSTAKNNGEKQLQVVPHKMVVVVPQNDRDDEEEKKKERLLANLQLQSNRCTVVPPPSPQPPSQTTTFCVFEYEEPDAEEIKRFAEIRDREWALQKRLDEARRKNKEPPNSTTPSPPPPPHQKGHKQKRKKNKHHSPNGTNNMGTGGGTTTPNKRRKLHAEITNRHESLKLKVKLTPTFNHNNNNKMKNTACGTKEKFVRKCPEPVPPTNLLMVVPPKKSQLDETILEQKIADLQQRCTVEKRNTPPPPVSSTTGGGTVTVNSVPPSLLQYPKTGFTVSKIDSTTTHTNSCSSTTTSTTTNNNNNNIVLKTMKAPPPSSQRPSLEITLVPPPGGGGTKATPTPTSSNAPKRPPPATIPLDRIKLKTGISIIPKLPVKFESSKCDNLGALDLSAARSTIGTTTLTKQNVQLSNLQMLSKVASDLNQKMNNNNNNNIVNSKICGSTTAPPPPPPPKPISSNSTPLKIPSLNPVNRILTMTTMSSCSKTAVSSPVNSTSTCVGGGGSGNLARLPKLNEINKAHFRMFTSPPIRHLRPPTNQNIRNIPNPSLLVRQHQNNFNLITNNNNNNNNNNTISNNNNNKIEKKDHHHVVSTNGKFVGGGDLETNRKNPSTVVPIISNK